ncbi:MAG: cysteine--tRNA ligase [Alphaproteobacteria bacterium]|nr:cysteine--tRNA ligase [Alphaproteobacteria bacterium]
MLKLFNTRTHSLEEFKPIDGSNTVRMYGCGPTVYNYAHIGNQRAYIFYDLLRRYLKFKGYNVVFAMNITDVDDKTIRSSREAGQSLRDYTTFYMNEFFKDWEYLNISRPDKVIRATDEIDAMVDTIEILMQKGHAYKAHSGDIFFKISTFPDYGKMANIDASKLKANADGRLADEYEKEDAQDFALWKAWTEADGDVYWDTRIGKGRPGWHIECSTMSHKYLGQPFDIHTGGVDLIFPHHTNEIAQSECAYGCLFANFFVHNAHLMVNGEKMSKSKNNFYTVRDLLNKGYDKRAIRYEFLKSSYRQTLDFMEGNMAGNKSVIDRLDNFMERLGTANGTGWNETDTAVQNARKAFEEAMDNDLNTSEALAAVFELIGIVNKNFDALSKDDANKIIDLMKLFDTVLGVLPEKTERTLTAEEQSLIDQRQAARQAKDWATADALKAELIARKIEVKDTPTGPQIRFID